MSNKMENWEKLSVLGGKKCRNLHACEEEEALCKTCQSVKRLQTCFMSIFLAVNMTVSLVECALLMKRFYENKGNISAALH